MVTFSNLCLLKSVAISLCVPSLLMLLSGVIVVSKGQSGAFPNFYYTQVSKIDIEDNVTLNFQEP